MNSALLTPASSAAFYWEISPISYHLTAAAKRISLTNSSGVLLRAENAPSGSSTVITVGTVDLSWNNFNLIPT
jgi:hypothetical protein